MNKVFAAFMALALLAACQQAGGYDMPQRIAASGAGLPDDVIAFLEDTSPCASFGNDTAFGRDDALAADRERLYCTGAAGEIGALRAKYADRPDVQAALRRFEDNL